MNAHQLHRMISVTYKSAWFMARRLRYAMSQEPLASNLAGVVEVNETYVGGKRRGTKRGRPKPGSHKTAVIGLIERGGRVGAMPIERIMAENLGAAMHAHVNQNAVLMTDELSAYAPTGRSFAGHETIKHGVGEYVRGSVHTNTVEGFFSLLKRGINGVCHHVGKGHLGRYVDEFAFRYDSRKVTDAERARLAVVCAEGKRLTYQKPAGASQN